MTDSPYPLDFLFSQITNVNFGCDWVGVGVDRGAYTDSLTTVRVDFLDMSGGTPGLLMVPSAPFTAYPHSVTASDLKRAAVTQAGRGMTAFGLRDILITPAVSYVHGTELYFRMPSLSPFHLKVSLLQNTDPFNTPTSVQVFTIPSTTMKAGLVLPPPRPKEAHKTFVAKSWSATFLVTPKTLNVSLQ